LAENYAGPGVILCAEMDDPLAVIEAIERIKRPGEPVFLYPRMTDPLEAFVERHFHAHRGDDDFSLMLALGAWKGLRDKGARPLGDWRDLPRFRARHLFSAFSLADAVFVSCEGDRQWWQLQMFSPPLSDAIIFPHLDRYPQRKTKRGDRIVVYAPGRTEPEVAYFTMTLSRHRSDLEVLLGKDDVPMLDEASVVVVADWHGGQTVRALAVMGHRIVAATSAAGAEFGLAIPFDPLDAGSLSEAVDIALSGEHDWHAVAGAKRRRTQRRQLGL